VNFISCQIKSLFPPDWRFESQIGDGGLFVRGDGHVHVGKFHVETGERRARAGDGLHDFIASGERMPVIFGHVEIHFDIRAESAGDFLRFADGCERTFIRIERTSRAASANFWRIIFQDSEKGRPKPTPVAMAAASSARRIKIFSQQNLRGFAPFARRLWYGFLGHEDCGE